MCNFSLNSDILHYLVQFLDSKASISALSQVCRSTQCVQRDLFRTVKISDCKAAKSLETVASHELWSSIRILWILPFQEASEAGNEGQPGGACERPAAWELFAAKFATKCARLRMLNIGSELPIGRGHIFDRLEGGLVLWFQNCGKNR